MARTAEGTLLTESHRLAQIRVRNLALAQAIRSWPALDPQRLDATAPIWLDLMSELVKAKRAESALLASRYYESFRRIEGAEGTFLALQESFEDESRIRASLAYTSVAKIKTGTAIGTLESEVVASSLASTLAALGRHVLDGGRATISLNVYEDDEALGYARVTSPRCCAFCAMLSSRGAVYTSDTVKFEAHDSCGCSAEPVFDQDAPLPGRASEFRTLWDESTQGYSGRAALNAFRRSLSR